MICRLCLSHLSKEISVPIFNKSGDCISSEVRKLITKYLQLELCSGDPVSTLICQECCEHLEDFHRFCIHIDQKQKTLQNQQPYEFFEMKFVEPVDDIVDVSLIKEELLELEIDPVCNDNIDCLSTEQKDYISLDVLRQHKEYKKKTKGTTTTKKTKVKTAQKSTQKLQNVADIQNELPSTGTEFTTTNLELSCDLCKVHIGNFEELTNHFEIQHSEQEAFVKCCGKKFTQTQSITNHFKRHRSPTKLICPICNKALCSEMNLNIHMNSKHNKDKKQTFKCHICEKEFRSQKNYENHIRRHNSETKYQIKCDKCKRSFSSTMRLKRHCQIMHKSVYPYRCQACLENFISKKDKEAHETFCSKRKLLKEERESRKSYVCEQCGKKFRCKSTFETHLLQHAGVVEPPAQCNICSKWLKHKNSLRLHLYSHDNAVNKCELCDHKAPTRNALKRHVKKVHRLEREYQCKYCDKSFKDSKSQEEHIATHTGAQLYSCPHCSKETRSSSNMYAHIKRMHPEEWLKAKLARSHDPNAKTNLEVLSA